MNAQRIGKLKLRLQKARAELLKAQPDFAQPLRELIYVATKDVYRISTNGFCIYFDPDWLQKLGLEMPTTMDELVEVLRAFKNGDPNGKDADGSEMVTWEPYTPENPRCINFFDEIFMQKEDESAVTKFIVEKNLEAYKKNN